VDDRDGNWTIRGAPRIRLHHKLEVVHGHVSLSLCLGCQWLHSSIHAEHVSDHPIDV